MNIYIYNIYIYIYIFEIKLALENAMYLISNIYEKNKNICIVFG